MPWPFINASTVGHKKLYHYQRFNPEHLADLILRKRIHCAQPGKLNDPWDCRPWFNTSQLLDNPTLLQDYLDAAYNNLTVHVPEGIKRLHDQKMHADPEAFRDELAGLSRSVQAEIARRRIYCLTPIPDNILMWSHYADNHRGISLEFDATVQLFWTALQVQYTKEYPAIPPYNLNPDHVANAILTKSDVWQYEQEFRIMGVPSRKTGAAIELDGDYLPIDTALIGVILGCEADAKAIRRFFMGHAPHMPLYQAERANDEYRLQIVPLRSENTEQDKPRQKRRAARTS